jgi:hypothetical protein
MLPKRREITMEKLLVFPPVPYCPPDASGLLRLLSALVDDAMLQDIAEADYGNDRDRHLARLMIIRDKGVIPSPLQWHPQEVLELIRWSEPDNPDWKPGQMGVAGHIMRAFCCATLLVAAGNGEEMLGISDTLIQLIGSLAALGLDNELPAGQMLAWLVPALSAGRHGANEQALACFAFIMLLIRRKPPPDEDTVLAACRWFELICRHHCDWLGQHHGQKFVELTAPDWRNLGMLDERWMALAYELDAQPFLAFSDAATARLRQISAMVVMAG